MNSAMNTVRAAVLSGAIIGFFSALSIAHAAGPFEGLAGQWSGTGKINMSDGSSERIRCNAAYNVAKDGNGLNLRLTCASDSYKIDARSQTRLNDGQLDGSWQELTRNLGGGVSGTARGNTIDATLETAGVLLRLYMVTNGAAQTVQIVPQQGLPIKNVYINMTRK